MIGSTHSPILVTWNCFLSSESIFEFCFLRWIHLIKWWYLHESDDWSNVFQLTRADFGLNFSIFNKKAFYISACQHFHFLKPAQGRFSKNDIFSKMLKNIFFNTFYVHFDFLILFFTLFWTYDYKLSVLEAFLGMCTAPQTLEKHKAKKGCKKF